MKLFAYFLIATLVGCKVRDEKNSSLKDLTDKSGVFKLSIVQKSNDQFHFKLCNSLTGECLNPFEVQKTQNSSAEEMTFQGAVIKDQSDAVKFSKNFESSNQERLAEIVEAIRTSDERSLRSQSNLTVQKNMVSLAGKGSGVLGGIALVGTGASAVAVSSELLYVILIPGGIVAGIAFVGAATAFILYRALENENIENQQNHQKYVEKMRNLITRIERDQKEYERDYKTYIDAAMDQTAQKNMGFHMVKFLEKFPSLTYQDFRLSQAAYSLMNLRWKEVKQLNSLVLTEDSQAVKVVRLGNSSANTNNFLNSKLLREFLNSASESLVIFENGSTRPLYGPHPDKNYCIFSKNKSFNSISVDAMILSSKDLNESGFRKLQFKFNPYGPFKELECGVRDLNFDGKIQSSSDVSVLQAVQRIMNFFGLSFQETTGT